MADQDSANQGNGSGEAANEAQFSVLAQYIKDLSVENPSSPQVFQWQVQPSLDVQFNLNAEKVADDVHEVSIKIEVSARSENGVHFVVDLTYIHRRGLYLQRERNINQLPVGTLQANPGVNIAACTHSGVVGATALKLKRETDEEFGKRRDMLQHVWGPRTRREFLALSASEHREKLVWSGNSPSRGWNGRV